MRLLRTALETLPRRARRSTGSTLALTLAAASFAAASLASITAPSVASAAEPKPAKGSAAQADQLFRDARVLLDQGHYREACRMFERSLEIEPSPGTLLNLGNCYEQDGDLARALSTFERALADSQLPQYEAKRNGWIKAGSQRIDSLLARVPVLNLTPSPTPGASVRLDGEELTQVRGQVRVNPGHHLLDVSAAGKRSLRREVDLRIAERIDLALPALEDTAIAPPLPSQTSPYPEPSASPRHSSALPWVLVGSGGLLATTGIVTGLMAKSKENALEKGCGNGPTCTNTALRSTRDTGEKLEIATYILWAAGGAGMIVGFTLLGLESGQEDAAQVSLGCGGGSCGLQATGTF